MIGFIKANRSTLLALTVTLSLFGCASGYIEPDDSTVSINFVNVSDRPMAIEIYRGSAQCTDRLIVHPAVAPGESRIIKVESGAISFSAVQDISSRWTNFGPEIEGCMLATTFQPVSGRTYTYTFHQEGGMCSYRLSEAGRPVTHEDRTWRRAFGESGPWCE